MQLDTEKLDEVEQEDNRVQTDDDVREEVDIGNRLSNEEVDLQSKWMNLAKQM